MKNNIKEEVLNYINKTYNEIKLNKKLNFKNIKIQDLKVIENYLKECNFIKVNECKNNDIICIYPESKTENMKILYTEELENKDSKYIVFKLFSELFIYLNGNYTFKSKNYIINNCYLFLYHLYILPDEKINYGKKFINTINQNLNSNFIIKYDIKITKEKLNYYLLLALNNNLKVPIFKQNYYEFNNGKIIIFGYYKLYISQGKGIIYYNNSKSFYGNDYPKKINNYNTYDGIITIILDNKNNLIKNKELIKEIKSQYKILYNLEN